MFDIGFSEILITALVALIVLGPERLPKAARFAGLWVRRARAQWESVRVELEREIAKDELQRTFKAPLDELAPQMRELGEQLRSVAEPAPPPASPPPAAVDPADAGQP